MRMPTHLGIERGHVTTAGAGGVDLCHLVSPALVVASTAASAATITTNINTTTNTIYTCMVSIYTLKMPYSHRMRSSTPTVSA